MNEYNSIVNSQSPLSVMQDSLSCYCHSILMNSSIVGHMSCPRQTDGHEFLFIQLCVFHKYPLGYALPYTSLNN